MGPGMPFVYVATCSATLHTLHSKVIFFVIIMASYDSGGGAPAANPFQGQLMAHQSQLNLMKFQLQQAVAMIQNMPSVVEFNKVMQDLDFGKRHVQGLSARCEALEKGMAEAQARADQASARCEALEKGMAEAQARADEAAAQFAELLTVVEELHKVVYWPKY